MPVALVALAPAPFGALKWRRYGKKIKYLR
jgi:hypothetical protein